MDSRVLTISNGYVNVTDVMPAMAPQTRRLSAGKGAPGDDSKNCAVCQACDLGAAEQDVLTGLYML